jgi:hypothetical protein
MGYFITISGTGIYNAKWQNDKYMMNWKGFFKGSGLGIVEVPSQHLPGGSEEYRKTSDLLGFWTFSIIWYSTN